MSAVLPKVKIFLSIESEYSQLEQDINAWISKAKPAKIISMQANIAPQTPSSSSSLSAGSFGSSDILVIILYESS